MALQAPILTGAIALIVVNNKIVGHMRDLRFSENMQRVEVKGLGTLITQEAPVTSYSGSLSCSFYEMNFKKEGIPDALRRDVGIANTQSSINTGIPTPSFEDNLILDTDGVDLYIYKKVKDLVVNNSGGPVPLYKPKKKVYCKIGRLLINSNSINITENGVAGRDQSFIFLDPIVYDPADPNFAD